MSAIMHAADRGDPFGATVCGAQDGWRTQIGTDVNCPDCTAALDTGAEETHLGMWAAEVAAGPPESTPEGDALMRDLARQALASPAPSAPTTEDGQA